MTLVTPANVKDRLTNISGIAITSGLTDPRLQDIIDENTDVVIAAFGASAETDLSTQRQSVAKGAIIRRCVADCLVAMRATTLDEAERARKGAMDDIDRCLEGASGAAKARTKLSFKGV